MVYKPPSRLRPASRKAALIATPGCREREPIPAAKAGRRANEEKASGETLVLAVALAIGSAACTRATLNGQIDVPGN